MSYRSEQLDIEEKLWKAELARMNAEHYGDHSIHSVSARCPVMVGHLVKDYLVEFGTRAVRRNWLTYNVVESGIGWHSKVEGLKWEL